MAEVATTGKVTAVAPGDAVVRCGEVDLAMKSTGQDGQELLTGLLLELAAPASRPAPQRR